MNKTAELLAPAGSFDVMKACIAAGADAVYMGLSKFSARAYADNAASETYLDAIDYAHLHGAKLYCTVNTLFKEKELYGELYETIKPLYEAGLDAVIVQDIGAMRLIHDHFPDLPIHASTQATVTGPGAVRFLQKLGVKRTVPARELSLTELSKIRRETGTELECFIHGALCYCYSGQCLMSSVIGGRSGNRGRCAQPCRLAYDVKDESGKYISRRGENRILSLKDLNTLEFLPEILNAGVYSLKIEGRMKKAEYAAGVTSIYRKYLDRIGKGPYRVEKEDQARLFDLFNRQGFTDGYYKKQNGRDMLTLKESDFREHDDAFIEEIREKYIRNTHKTKLTGTYLFRAGEPYQLTVRVSLPEISGSITVFSDPDVIAEPASKKPAAKEDAEKQLGKLGDTDFCWESLTGEIEGDLFLPVSQLNAFRRKAVQEVREWILSHYRRTVSEAAEIEKPSGSINTETPSLHVLVRTKEQFEAAVTSASVRMITLESVISGAEQYKTYTKRAQAAGKEINLAVPAIFRNKAEKYWSEHAEALKQADFDGFLIRSFEESDFLDRSLIKGKRYADQNLYTFNSLAVKEMLEDGFENVTVPLELNAREAADTGFAGQELTVYGWIPMMVSANCIHRTLTGCDQKKHMLTLIDRTGQEMPVFNECRYCLNTIYNGRPLSLLDCAQEIKKVAPGSIRLEFLTEDRAETEKIIGMFSDVLINGEPMKENVPVYTRGHFRRGVE